MIAIMTVAAFLLYGLLCIWVVSLVVKWARKRGKSPRRWGIIAGLVMYHLVFWDFLPTLLVYHYYCVTKAGLLVYKTPEQWKAENPGVAETLTWKVLSDDERTSDRSIRVHLNQRIDWIIKGQRNQLLPVVPVGIREETIIDLETKEILTKWIGVSSGKLGRELTRPWIFFGPCLDGSLEFSKLVTDYKQLGRKAN